MVITVLWIGSADGFFGYDSARFIYIIGFFAVSLTGKFVLGYIFESPLLLSIAKEPLGILVL